MKKIIVSVLTGAGLVLSSHGQGVITFDSSSSAGVLQMNGVTDANTDVNATLLYFNGSIYTPLVTFLLSDTTPTFGNFQSTSPSTQAAGGDVSAFGGGILYDNAGNTYQITTINSGSVASFEVEAWLGNFSTYAAAVAGSGSTYGTSAAFNETLSAAAAPINASMDQMPTFNMVTQPVPEPTTLALAGLGGAALLAFRRRKA